jgi:hypothetical protein
MEEVETAWKHRCNRCVSSKLWEWNLQAMARRGSQEFLSSPHIPRHQQVASNCIRNNFSISTKYHHGRRSDSYIHFPYRASQTRDGKGPRSLRSRLENTPICSFRSHLSLRCDNGKCTGPTPPIGIPLITSRAFPQKANS